MIDGLFLLLGSNLGDKELVLTEACDRISKAIGPISRKSSLYSTSAWGKTDQPDFLNQVIQVSTALSAREVLMHILQIEKDMGRIRQEKWGARIIDIDILYYNDLVLEEGDLSIPHPGIPGRRFTLVPLAEIAATFIHPTIKLNQIELLDQCPDQLPVTKVEH